MGKSEYIKYISQVARTNQLTLKWTSGAYTVRCVSGMIRNCGILRYKNKGLVNRAFEIYRSRDPDHHPNGEESKKFRKLFSYGFKIDEECENNDKDENKRRRSEEDENNEENIKDEEKYVKFLGL